MRRGIIAIGLLVAAVGAGADMTWNAHTKVLGVQVAPLPEQLDPRLYVRMSALVPTPPPVGMVACWWGRAGFCCREGEPIACIRFMGPKKTPHYKRLS